MDIIGMFKSSPLTFIILIIAVVAYFVLSEKARQSGKKSAKEINKMTDEERAEYRKSEKERKLEKSQKKRTNYSTRTSTVYDERHYESAPKDGTSLHQKGVSGVKHIQKNKASRAMERLPEYKHYLEEIRIKNLNHLARNLELINNDAVDDIRQLQKKGYFKNVEINEATCRIFYKDQAFNSDFITDDEMKSFEDAGKDNPYEILKTDFEGEHVPGVNITHTCPHCGTPNIIDSDTKEYNCYYCLDKVVVKGKNKK